MLLLALAGVTGAQAGVRAVTASGVLITAVYFDPSVAGEASEAIQIQKRCGIPAQTRSNSSRR